MSTYICMAVLVLGLAIATIYKVKYQPNKDTFMSVDDTTFLRGFWCIIVVLVHVPEMYQNRIQDMLGSFAYIGVTFFFMTSGYGLKWSIEHKPGYMDHFWRKRLPSLLIPALLANLLSVWIKAIGGSEITLLSLININGWVKVLLVNYLFFWIVYYAIPSILGKCSGIWQEVLISAICVTWSVVEYTAGILALRWWVERLGFMYGVLLAANYDKVSRWIHKSWIKKNIVLVIAAFLLGVAYLRFKPIFFWGDYLLKTVLGIAITVFELETVSCFRVGNKVTSFLGGISYEVYLVHGIVFGALILTGIKFDSGTFILCSIFITMIVSIGMHKISEIMIKMLKLLKLS